jgi:hypothetical protein
MRLLLLLIVLAPCSILAQSDSISNRIYHSTSPQFIDQEIYNGREHLGYAASIEGIAYYQTKEWQPGTIVYRDVFYPEVFLKYDLVQNEVIIRHFNGGMGITLFTPRIKEFSLAGKKFIHFTGSKNSNLPPGLYEELEKGTISLYVNRSKSIFESTSGLQIERKFIESNTYYALKDGIWYKIRKDGTLFDLVRDKKNEIKNDLKKKGLKYKKNQEATLKEIVSYYNNATH